MELIFLDSDVLIEILNKNSRRSKDIFIELEKYSGEDVVISALVLEEVFFGILKVAPNVDNLKEHPIFEMPIIDFTKRDAVLAAEIEYEMEKLGKKKPRVDSLIASTVINHESILFTFNIKHYEDIEGLQIINLRN